MSEEVGLTYGGVAVHVRTVNGNKFEVEFTDSAMVWLTDSRMAVAAEDLHLTVGEMNQHWLVQKLNEFVTQYMQSQLVRMGELNSLSATPGYFKHMGKRNKKENENE